MAAMPPSIQIVDFLPTVLGLLAVYLLFPRPGSPPRLFGAAVGLAALGIAGWQLAHTAATMPLIESILFYSFSALALFGAVQLVTQSNPARGAVSFALVVLNVCGLFLLHGAPFLAAGTVIIYAGAIVVTFLFVIMLSQQHGISDADGRCREPLLSCAAGALLLGVMFAILRGHYDPGELDGVLAAIDVSVPKVQEIDDALNRLDGQFAVKEELLQRWQTSLNKIKTAETPTGKANEMADFRAAVMSARDRIGDISPPAHIALSPFGGLPVNRTEDRRLPAGNVAALGRLLFTDYLLAVELAGTLLLVATIGAIAITHRTGRRTA
jgi:NADH:ubiquinone oxidoreductase subunit 6 (subunit J)